MQKEAAKREVHHDEKDSVSQRVKTGWCQAKITETRGEAVHGQCGGEDRWKAVGVEVGSQCMFSIFQSTIDF